VREERKSSQAEHHRALRIGLMPLAGSLVVLLTMDDDEGRAFGCVGLWLPWSPTAVLPRTPRLRRRSGSWVKAEPEDELRPALPPQSDPTYAGCSVADLHSALGAKAR
jgi:hypothetical protein